MWFSDALSFIVIVFFFFRCWWFRWRLWLSVHHRWIQFLHLGLSENKVFIFLFSEIENYPPPVIFASPWALANWCSIANFPHSECSKWVPGGRAVFRIGRSPAIKADGRHVRSQRSSESSSWSEVWSLHPACLALIESGNRYNWNLKSKQVESKYHCRPTRHSSVPLLLYKLGFVCTQH